MKGDCSYRNKVCLKVKTDNHVLASRVWEKFNRSVEFSPSATLENRKEILLSNFPSFQILTGLPEIFDSYDGDFSTLEFQDNLFLSNRREKERKQAIDNLLKTVDCKPSKSMRYHKGSPKYRAQMIINAVLNDMQLNRTR
jgi:hypothetical protein